MMSSFHERTSSARGIATHLTVAVSGIRTALELWLAHEAFCSSAAAARSVLGFL